MTSDRSNALWKRPGPPDAPLQNAATLAMDSLPGVTFATTPCQTGDGNLSSNVPTRGRQTRNRY